MIELACFILFIFVNFFQIFICFYCSFSSVLCFLSYLWPYFFIVLFFLSVLCFLSFFFKIDHICNCFIFYENYDCRIGSPSFSCCLYVWKLERVRLQTCVRFELKLNLIWNFLLALIFCYMWWICLIIAVFVFSARD